MKNNKYAKPVMEKIIETYHENIQETSEFINKKCKKLFFNFISYFLTKYFS